MNTTADTTESVERATDDLVALPFVGEFKPAVRAALLVGACELLFDSGDQILAAGDIPQELCIVLAGMVELSGTISEQTCGVLLLASGDVITPTAVLYGEPCLTSTIALRPTRILTLRRQTVLEEAAKHPEVSLALARIVGAHWRMAVRQIIDLQCRSAPERLGAFLLKFADASTADPVELPFAKGALATRLGISRETLSRAIQVVATNGIVLRGSRIVVRDRAKAEEFCGPAPYPKPDEFALDVHAL